MGKALPSTPPNGPQLPEGFDRFCLYTAPARECPPEVLSVANSFPATSGGVREEILNMLREQRQFSNELAARLGKEQEARNMELVSVVEKLFEQHGSNLRRKSPAVPTKGESCQAIQNSFKG